MPHCAAYVYNQKEGKRTSKLEKSKYNETLFNLLTLILGSTMVDEIIEIMFLYDINSGRAIYISHGLDPR